MEGVGQIRAIVFDANVFGANVEPNVATIRNWSEACEQHEAALWIPEVVAWELAQRVVQECERIEREVRAHNVRRRKWGFPATTAPPPIDDAEIISRLERAGAIIVPLEGEAAVSAIRDQVLLRGPASRKKEIKTGAADSAWIRSVIDYNDGEIDGLVFVTGDVSALAATCETLGVNLPRIAKHLGEIRYLLEETVEASDEQASGFATLVDQLLTGPELSDVELINLTDLSYSHNWWEVDLGVDPDAHWELQDTFVQPGPAQVIGSVQYDAWSKSLSGTVRIDVEVEEQYARQDQWGDVPEYRSFFYSAWIQGEVTLFEDQEPGLDAIELTDVEFGVDSASVYSQAL